MFCTGQGYPEGTGPAGFHKGGSGFRLTPASVLLAAGLFALLVFLMQTPQVKDEITPEHHGPRIGRSTDHMGMPGQLPAAIRG